MATLITVKEQAEHYEAPERATVSLVIEGSGYDRHQVHQQVANTLASVRTGIEQLRNDQQGPITWHSIANADTWSWKLEDGGVHFHERVSVEAKFNDFTKLGEWLTDYLKIPGVRLNFIRWTLTEPHRAALKTELRQRTVRLAREKAEEYAAAAGLRVSAVKTIADAGMLSRGHGYQASSDFGVSRGAKANNTGSETGGYGFSPEDIRLTAAIEAEFWAE